MLVIGLGYTWYQSQSFKNDIIHKGCMITGKYDLDSTQAEYLTGYYSRKHFERPKFGFLRALKDKFCGCTCSGDSDEDNYPKIQETQPSGLAADKKDDQVLDKALDGI
jgi:hypothetical protein